MSDATGKGELAVLAKTEVRVLHSSIVNDDFKLFIAHPVMPLAADQRLKVILALDANTGFGLVVDTVRLMSMEGIVPPNVIVVGIGYLCEWFFPEAFVKRSRDYTPVKSLHFDKKGLKMVPGTSNEDLDTGGAAKFLKFIQDELFPYIQKEFDNVDVEDSLITGASFGGLFSSWVLLTQPEVFKRYLICSPSLWWVNEWAIHLGEEVVQNRKDLPARVFVGCGALETNEILQKQIAAIKSADPEKAEYYDDSEPLRMAEHFETFWPKFKNARFPSLQLDTHVFDQESHCSVYGAALARGLRLLYQ